MTGSRFATIHIGVTPTVGTAVANAFLFSRGNDSDYTRAFGVQFYVQKCTPSEWPVSVLLA